MKIEIDAEVPPQLISLIRRLIKNESVGVNEYPDVSDDLMRNKNFGYMIDCVDGNHQLKLNYPMDCYGLSVVMSICGCKPKIYVNEGI